MPFSRGPIHFLRKSVSHCYFRNPSPISRFHRAFSLSRSTLQVVIVVQRRRLVSPTDRVTGGNKNPRGFSPSVINERALESLESLPVCCRFDFHDGSRRAIPRIGLKFRGKVYGAFRQCPKNSCQERRRGLISGILSQIIFLFAF